MDSNPLPRKRKKMAAAGVLNIDNLPDSIIEILLTHLTIRDAAKTSILSKKWNNHWRNVPYLLFDNSFHRSDSVQEQVHFLLYMSQVLLHHRGSIHKFTLSIDLEVQYFPQIDNLLLFLRDKDVHELTFTVIPPDHRSFKIPSCLFSYQQLRHLYLAHCDFTSPPSFEGFPHLISLRFRGVTIYDKFLDDPLNFISKCPLLDYLSIKECFGSQPFKIDAPKLKFFHIFGYLSFHIFFTNTPLLSTVDIYHLEDFGCAEDELVALFESLPLVENLCIAKVSLNDRIFLPSPSLPITISHLKVLELAADFSYESGIFLVLALIISSPNLQKLKVTPDMRRLKVKGGFIPVFKHQDLSDVTFQNLQELQMVFYGKLMEVEFVKFMVAKSVVLKTVTLYYRPKYERKVSIAVAELASASPKVNINLVEEVETQDSDL